MSNQGKWQMNRAGLLNFWYYDDTILNFSEGKMLLRGANGAGKSVTMQSLLPVLLDGKTSSDRLDPFKSQARRMQDYLLGEKEVVNRDERTGYLFLEYKREGTNQYITTGIGLQAKRSKPLNFWGFVLTDNRRIGFDFELFEYETHQGEKQKLPLTKNKLTNRVGKGGHVVEKRSDYRDLVNRYIFGFKTSEMFEDLIKLLIQLRSPKLSKDFKPSVIFEILNAALPPLDDDDLRDLSEAVESMDQIKQQLDQLDDEHSALQRVMKKYDIYNAHRLIETGSQYKAMQKRVEKEKQLEEKETEAIKKLEEDISQRTEQTRTLSREYETLMKQKERLQKHEVWDLAAEKTKEETRLTALTETYHRSDQQLTDKKKQEIRLKEQYNHYVQKKHENEAQRDDLLLDMANDASSASFLEHEQNVLDFKRHSHQQLDCFSVWEKETEAHYHRLDHLGQQLQIEDQMKQKISDLDLKNGDLKANGDEVNRTIEQTLVHFEELKQDKLAQIHEWVQEHTYMQVSDEVLQQTSRHFTELYESTTFENIRESFVDAHDQYQQGLTEEIGIKRSELLQLTTQINEQEKQLKEIQNKKDPEPPQQSEATLNSRKVLRATGVQAIPFYEAVEFQEHVTQTEREQIEAACIDSGLVNALITSEEIVLNHDRVICPKPQVMAHTLADYLKPVSHEETKVSPSTIDDVLRSILLQSDESHLLTLNPQTGEYQIGLIKGHSQPVDRVRFIGKTARKQYREEQMAQIRQEIAVLAKEKEGIQIELAALTVQKKMAQEALSEFPGDAELREIFLTLSELNRQASQLKEAYESQLLELSENKTAYRTLKYHIHQEAQKLNLQQSFEAYQEAKEMIRRYEKALQALKLNQVQQLNLHDSETQMDHQLTEVREDIDYLSGELADLKDKKQRVQMNLAEMEKELRLHSIEKIQEHISHVQSELTKKDSEIKENSKKLIQAETLLPGKQDQQTKHKQQIAFYEALSTAWQESFKAEKRYHFIQLPETLKQIDQQVDWLLKTYPLLKTATSNQVNDDLSQTYFEQKNTLVAYRMIDRPSEFTPLDTLIETAESDQLILIKEWESQASRRLIELEFRGERVSPYYVSKIIEEDRLIQKNLLDHQDRELYEEILFQSIGRKIRNQITQAQEWTKQMTALMEKSNSTSGITISIKWEPKRSDNEMELDTKTLVDLLRHDRGLLKESDLDQVVEHFRFKIQQAKELIEVNGKGDTLFQVLREVLDYRSWFDFQLYYQREGQSKHRLTNNKFNQFSGGEKAMAMYIPLFTACYSRYLGAAETAPYIITLDEAFAGVDEMNINAMFGLVEELDFNYMMNSQALWGDYETVSSLAINELIRPINSGHVVVESYHWNGQKRVRTSE